MIQYITMLFTYEHNQILFHVTPCHDGSHCKNESYHDLKCEP